MRFLAYLLFSWFFLKSSLCVSQNIIQYKTIGKDTLFLELYLSKRNSEEKQKKLGAMVFFFGGGWYTGNRSHFLNHAKYFSNRGLACFLADYRTKEKYNTTPFEAVKDAKSVMRYIRDNAERWNIDPGKIIASGGSAGGHLALATALIDDYNENDDNLSISPIPNALVLFNPVLDNGPGGFGYQRVKSNFHAFSPLHNIRKGAPPTIIFLGTDDKHIPVATAKYFKVVMERVGSKCDLRLYEGQKHGFFNYSNKEYYQRTLLEADFFLQSLGYIEPFQNFP